MVIGNRGMMDGLKVVINPRGWLGRPLLTVLNGSDPLLTAYVGVDGVMRAWLTYWGMFGVYKTEDVDAKFVAALMGWSGERR